jgi:glycine betaine/proline transport system substrate-binding protein
MTGFTKILAVAALAFGVTTGAAVAGDSDACKTVKFADVGWTDITSTTAITSRILTGLGYTPTTTVLSVPVTYASMKSKDIDVFLGNWQPSMENDRKAYVEDKSVVVTGANLPEGAKYTLAVPQYTYDKGLKDFADITKFKDSLQSKIYGIEPGNDGNRLVQSLIDGNKDGLKEFQLVESWPRFKVPSPATRTSSSSAGRLTR